MQMLFAVICWGDFPESLGLFWLLDIFRLQPCEKGSIPIKISYCELKGQQVEFCSIEWQLMFIPVQHVHIDMPLICVHNVLLCPATQSIQYNTMQCTDH